MKVFRPDMPIPPGTLDEVLEAYFIRGCPALLQWADRLERAAADIAILRGALELSRICESNYPGGMLLNSAPTRVQEAHVRAMNSLSAACDFSIDVRRGTAVSGAGLLDDLHPCLKVPCGKILQRMNPPARTLNDIDLRIIHHEFLKRSDMIKSYGNTARVAELISQGGRHQKIAELRLISDAAALGISIGEVAEALVRHDMDEKNRGSHAVRVKREAKRLEALWERAQSRAQSRLPSARNAKK